MLSVRMGPSCGFLVIAIVVIPPLVVPEVLGLAVAVLALLPLPQPASATRAARPAGKAANASRVLIILVSLVFGQGARTIGLSQRPPSANRARFRPARRVGLVVDGVRRTCRVPSDPAHRYVPVILGQRVRGSTAHVVSRPSVTDVTQGSI